MRRGKSQVLYKFLPRSIIDYNQGRCIAIVKNWHSISVPKELLNKPRVIKTLERQFIRFNGTTGYAKLTDSDAYEMLEPNEVEVDLYPLTFVCKNCQRVHQFTTPAHLEKATHSTARCPNCKGVLVQQDFVYVHTCGAVSGLNIAACKQHKYAHMLIDKKGSRSPASWWWKCGECQTETFSLNNRCQGCNSGMLHPVPFRKSDVYYPQAITLVNLHNIDEQSLAEESHFKMVIAEYLGIAQKHGIPLEKLLQPQAPGVSRKSFAELLRKDGTRSDEEIRAIVEKLPPDTDDVRQKIVEELDQLIGLQDKDLFDVAMELAEFRETLKLPTSRNLDNYVVKCKDEDPARYDIVQTFPGKMERIGIKKTYVMNDLSITSVVYGFTRADADPKKCVLNAFPKDKSFKDKVPLYVNRVETEAMLFELDRYRIVCWLKENGIISELPENNEIALRAWFLKNVNKKKISAYGDIEEGDQITKAIYTLIHTISHALLIKGAVQCGLDKDSLAEIIFPSVPAILIYANNAQGLQLGGMHTLFENKIFPWIDMTLEKVENCIYDPICMSDQHGACHYCIHLSEGFSCPSFNKNLARETLIGNTANGRIGFWNKAFYERARKIK